MDAWFVRALENMDKNGTLFLVVVFLWTEFHQSLWEDKHNCYKIEFAQKLLLNNSIVNMHWNFNFADVETFTRSFNYVGLLYVWVYAE